MDFGSKRTVRVYISAVLFLFLCVKAVRFFLCTVGCHSIIKSVFLYTFDKGKCRYKECFPVCGGLL
ncbi:hypothetical protein DWZ40_02525 [Clostridium sp. AF32-12BH]|nr:hypothetical protein DWZ40_02525 [Clostridium sp. AF32-12BH]